MEEAAVSIERRFYWEALRGLVGAKAERYIHTSILRELYPHHPLSIGEETVHIPEVLGIELQNCRFTVTFHGNKVVFTGSVEYDKGEKDYERTFLQILEKFTTWTPKSLKKFLPHLASSPKESLSSSALERADSLPIMEGRADPRVRKRTRRDSTSRVLLALASDLSSSQRYDVIGIMQDPSLLSGGSDNNKTYARLLVLHSLVNPQALKFLLLDTHLNVSALRKEHLLTPREVEYLHVATRIHRGDDTFSRTPDLIVDDRLREFFPKERITSAGKTHRTPLPRNPGKLFVRYMIEQSQEDPSFFARAFSSFPGGCPLRILQFFENLNGRQAKTLASEKDSVMIRDLMGFAARLFSTNNISIDAKVIGKVFRLMMDYVKKHKQLPPAFSELLSSTKFLFSLKQRQILQLANIISKYNLGNTFVEEMTTSLLRTRASKFVLRLLTDPDLKPFRRLFEADGERETKWLYSLLLMDDFRVDLAVLSFSEYCNALERTWKTALGTYLRGKLFERLKATFELRNIGSEARASMSTPQMRLGTTAKLEQLKAHTCVSFNEIRNAMKLGRISGKMTSKDEWLRAFKSNLEIIYRAFLPHLAQHLADLSRIYDEFRVAATARLEKMDPESRNPISYRLGRFPPEMTQHLSESDKQEFSGNLHQMSNVFNGLPPKRVSLDSRSESEEVSPNEVLFGFISTVKIARELLDASRTHAPRVKKGSKTSRSRSNSSATTNPWDLAHFISSTIVKFFQQKGKNPDPLFGGQTEYDVTHGVGDILYLQRREAELLTAKLLPYIAVPKTESRLQALVRTADSETIHPIPIISDSRAGRRNHQTPPIKLDDEDSLRVIIEEYCAELINRLGAGRDPFTP